MSIFRDIVRQSLPILLICIFGEILAGIFLLNIETYISVLPGLLILVPATMGTRGNILGIFSARLTSALHLGTIKPIFRRNIPLNSNIKTGIFLSVLISSFSGLVAHFACVFLGFESMGALNFVLIALMTAIFSDSFLIFVSVLVSFTSFKRNIDPDNILIPIVTTVSDFTSIMFLFVSVYLVQILI